MEQIEADLREARGRRKRIKKVFLENGDPFVLSADKLKQIAEKIEEIIPEVENISMFATIKNIINKTDDELKELRKLKINNLNVGIESGLEEAVEFMNKGYTVEVAKRELKRLENAGMDYSLENGDPFVLSADKLKQIAEKIEEIIPEVENISMFATIKNIIDKTDDELKELRKLKINNLNVGIESGLEEAVEFMNKGYTVEVAKREFKRLENAGMDYSINIITGCGGSDKRRENAIKTAELVNELNPKIVFVGSDKNSGTCQRIKSKDSICGEYLR